MRPLQSDSEIIGSKFHRLTVIRRAGKSTGDVTLWHCQCECGGTIDTPLFPLRAGRTKSCGCQSRENTRDLRFSHGMSKVREYTIWCGMKDRCLNKRNKGYPRYGGRGVTVHPEWITSFEAFISHIGMSPQDGQEYSLDRIDSSRGYEPGNVRWATKEIQANNTKANVFITAFGRTQTLAQWSRETGIKPHVIRSRINMLGWKPEDALSTPVGRGRREAAPVKYEPYTWCG